MKDFIDIQLSICGAFEEGQIKVFTNSLKNIDKGHVIGKFNHWKVVDPLAKDFDPVPFLCQLEHFELSEIIQREREIRGHGQIQATANSILNQWQYTIYIRSSLFPHFFSTGSKMYSIVTFNDEIPNIINGIENCLAELKLTIGLVVFKISIPKADINGVLQTFNDVEKDQLNEDYILEKLYQDYPTFIILHPEEAGLDISISDISLYNFWQSFESLRIIKDKGEELVSDCRKISDKIKCYEMEDIQPKTLNEITNFKKDILGLEIEHSKFTQMMNTLDSFREYQLSKVLHLIEQHKCAETRCVLKNRFHQDYISERSTLNRIESIYDQFVKESVRRLSTIDSVNQNIFNINLQVFLKRLQIVSVILAVASFLVAAASLAVAIISLTSMYVGG